MQFQVRQGDVFIERVADLPTHLAPVPRDALGRIVLQEGEVTGHAHAVLEPDATLYATPGATADAVERWLQVGAGGATVVHEEHGAIVLPPGDYVVRRQREYAPEAIRLVAD